MLVMAGFELRHDREEADEKQKECREQADGAEKKAGFGQGRLVGSRNRWEMVGLEAAHDDGETVEPDAYADGEADEDAGDGAVARGPEPEQLRDQDAVDDGRPVQAGIIAGHAVEHGLLGHPLREQGGNDLVEKEIARHESARENELPEQVDVL